MCNLYVLGHYLVELCHLVHWEEQRYGLSYKLWSIIFSFARLHYIWTNKEIIFQSYKGTFFFSLKVDCCRIYVRAGLIQRWANNSVFEYIHFKGTKFANSICIREGFQKDKTKLGLLPLGTGGATKRPRLFFGKSCCIFPSKKPCLKVQNLQYKFLDWKWPPPLCYFSENSSNLVAWPVP